MKLTDDVKQSKLKHFKQYRTAIQKLTNKENLVRFLHQGKPVFVARTNTSTLLECKSVGCIEGETKLNGRRNFFHAHNLVLALRRRTDHTLLTLLKQLLKYHRKISCAYFQKRSKLERLARKIMALSTGNWYILASLLTSSFLIRGKVFPAMKIIKLFFYLVFAQEKLSKNFLSYKMYLLLFIFIF